MARRFDWKKTLIHVLIVITPILIIGLGFNIYKEHKFNRFGIYTTGRILKVTPGRSGYNKAIIIFQYHGQLFTRQASDYFPSNSENERVLIQVLENNLDGAIKIVRFLPDTTINAPDSGWKTLPIWMTD